VAVRIRDFGYEKFSFVKEEDGSEKFIDKAGEKRRRKQKDITNARGTAVPISDDWYEEQEAYKGVRGMPRLSETTKDVVSCEKLRGGANDR